MVSLEARKAGEPGTPVVDAVPAGATDGQAALQAISSVQPTTGKRAVRFVGDAYYATLFAFSDE
jgi:hypothetical protein